MPTANHQTWTRLARIRLRSLANDVATEALNLSHLWSKSGEGRNVKAATERISQLIGASPLSSDLDRSFTEIAAAADEFDEILKTNFFVSHLADISFRRENKRVSLRSLLEQQVNDVRDYIGEYRADKTPISATERDFLNALKSVVPEQGVGPFQFSFSNQKLRVDHQVAGAAPGRRASVEAARATLLRTSQEIIDFLAASNLDRRLLEEVREMRRLIDNQQDVIALGLQSLVFQSVVNLMEDQLPGLHQGKLVGFAQGVVMFAAQFPEWAEFNETAALAEFTQKDVEQLYDTGTVLIGDLKKQNELVDPEVPRVVLYLLETIRDPRRAIKRSVFASIQTLANLVSVILTSAGDLIGAAFKGAKSGTTTAVKAGLLIWAANAASSLDSSAGGILHSAWLGKAAKVVLSKLEKIGTD